MGGPLQAGHRGFTNGSVLQAKGTTAAGHGADREGRINGTAKAPGRTNGLASGVGRTNGLTNGIGRTNGLTNGVGRTNGLTNGLGRTNGLTNGVGRTNGISNGVRLRQNQLAFVPASDLRRGAGIIAASAVLVLVLAIFLGTQVPPVSPFAVDGNFSEWATVPLYADPVDNVPAQADLISYGVHVDPGVLFLYAKMRGPLFAGSNTSYVYVALDDPATKGYILQGMEADYLLEMWGWNGTLQGTSMREWTGAPDRDNASALRAGGSFAAAVVGSEFELGVRDADIGFSLSRDIRLMILSQANDQTDSSAIVGKSPGALVVTQRPLTTVVSGPGAVLELHLQALGADVQVTNLTVDHAGGGAVSLPSLPIYVLAGQDRVVYIQLNPSGLPATAFVTVQVTAVDATIAGGTTLAPVTLGGDGARLYVASEPSGHRVDGVFDDWTVTSADANDSVPASVDILASAVSVPSDAFFFVRTEGPILAGAVLPERRGPAPQGNVSVPPPIYIPRRAGEDLLRIYADTDDRNTVGVSVGGIIANRLIEVRGRAGHVTASAMYAWNATTWDWTPSAETFDLAFVGPRLEGMANASFLGPLNNLRVVFETTDWSGVGDITDLPTTPSLSGPSLAASSVPSPLHANPPDEINAPPLTNTPTVDGNCNSFSGEYNGAAIGSNANITFAVGRRDDTQFVYVCIRVTADTTRSSNDWGEVIFDTLHNGGSAPQTDDRLLWVFGNGDTTLKEWQGNGAGWNGTCPSCDPGNLGASRFSTYEWYEFKARYTDVWGTLTPSANQTAGFAIIAFNNPSPLYTWGGPAVNENVPDTWGHIFYSVSIPEFPMPALAAIVMIGIPLLRRRFIRKEKAPTTGSASERYFLPASLRSR